MVVTESTARFLEAAADDLRVQLRGSGDIAGIRAVELGGGVRLVATVRVGETATELTGTGETLVAAYGDLLRHAAEPMLAAAFRELLTG